VILWHEWDLLQGERGKAQQAEIIGFRDIAPTASYAEPPGDWFQTAEGESLLWSRWDAGKGHQWFHFVPGDIERRQLLRPKTQFSSRAIDYPVAELNGGAIWKRIPPESPVVGHTLSGVNCVYPVVILAKVQTVNDLVEGHPFLVSINWYASPNDAVSIFDAERDGHRVTLAPTGYFHEGKPLLYDRGTESLWREDDEALKAIAGPQRGTQLRRVAHPTPVTWKAWLASNRESRLVVGADRSRGVPLE
jgi:hypothetical protein